MKPEARTRWLLAAVLGLHGLLLLALWPRLVGTFGSGGPALAVSLLDGAEKTGAQPAAPPKRPPAARPEPAPTRIPAAPAPQAPAAPSNAGNSAATGAPAAANTGGGDNAGPRAVRAGQLDCVNRSPDYPSQARMLGEQGTVVVRITIDENGRVERADVVTSSRSRLLDQAAVDAALGSRCKPFIDGGRAWRVAATRPYVFDLH